MDLAAAIAEHELLATIEAELAWARRRALRRARLRWFAPWPLAAITDVWLP